MPLLIRNGTHMVYLIPSPGATRRPRQRPEGEGANLDRRLVPYHGKCKRIQSRVEFIYIYISNIYNMSGRVVSDIQTRAEGEWLYI